MLWQYGGAVGYDTITFRILNVTQQRLGVQRPRD